MSMVGQKEIVTQRRVLEFFEQVLGYDNLGVWEKREDNSNVEEHLLRVWLTEQKHDGVIIEKTIRELNGAKVIGGGKTLYDANRDVYEMLRYGVKVQPEVGEHNITVWLIDWDKPENNHFAVAEEVTISGEHNKRPDIVLYINGIALGVLELKRSTISVAEGIRQNLDSQKKEFIQPFFTTVQFVMAGNDIEGLRYGMIETPERYTLTWKEQSEIENPLDRGLHQVCRKERFLELVHDFIVFDAGVKKTCRHNQYFGVRAAQEHVKRREGGIIWHTQGSGKTLVMIWLAKWIRENVKDARVLLITDRTELDEQIESRFTGVKETIYRTKSGADLVSVLNESLEWLICSLVQKFGKSDEGDLDTFIQDIESHLPKGFRAKGELFVFVDECHRSHTDKLHKAMKAMVPGAMFVGFTGTPLLKMDKQKSVEVFGSYIHTYKYDEAVSDRVVLDLQYEARDIDQSITSQEKVDKWFELKTKGLTDLARAQLKRRWGTMQRLLSSQDRLEKIVADILFDMETRDRLCSGRGNAMLVSSSIYQACKLFELFQDKGLKGKSAIVTSYRPTVGDIKGEESGEGQTEKLHQYEIYRKMLATHFDESEDAASNKVEQFEKDVKKRFIDDPGQMQLLIVVDKLLTGFDAPPATYLYIDKNMQDHGLFQAICRVNRLDSEDKEYGYIVDYKDLFKSLEKSIHEYTGEAFEGYDEADVAGLLKDRLTTARERLEDVRETVKALCEPVEPPQDQMAYIRFFCGTDNSDDEAIQTNERKRVALYKSVGELVRAYANLANEMEQAGYTDTEAQEVKSEVQHYEKVREEVKMASGDYIDMKLYEPAMRHLLDTYIRAEESTTLSAFEDLTLVQLLVDRGEDAVDELPTGIRENTEAVAETIENNVRKVIIDEAAVNPAYYQKMSELLDALIVERKKQAVDYKAYLRRIVELTRKVSKPETATSYPSTISTSPQRALFDNLDQNEQLAVGVDDAIRGVKKADWRGNRFKEREVRNAIRSVLGDDSRVDQVFEMVKNQRDY
jgi:type I restriction enzyme, R subunit